jgi:lipoprotein-anchoring transpeptidase ErfK/SrfK
VKRLTLFCASAGFLLGSNSPPPQAVAEPPPASILAAVAAAEEPLIPAPPPTLIEAAPVAAPPIVEAPSTPSPKAKKPKPRWAEAPKSDAPRPAAGLRVHVSLDEQKAYVMRGGEVVATSPVSTGKRGHETPVGTFRVLQKKVHHRSSKYDNAPMPYMQRLTNYGIALHAGRLPGYPASHGCIRLPSGFARKLYAMTDHGTTVTIARARPKLPRASQRARA